MKIKVHDVSSEGISLPLSNYSARQFSKGLEIDNPIEGKLLITKQGGTDIHIRGSISTRIRLACGRCLVPFAHPVRTEFYLDCTPAIKTSFGQEHRLYGEELNLHFYQGDTIDLDEIIESQLCLETPMAPLCQSDCQGLCIGCGEKLDGTLHNCSRIEESKQIDEPVYEPALKKEN